MSLGAGFRLNEYIEPQRRAIEEPCLIHLRTLRVGHRFCNLRPVERHNAGVHSIHRRSDGLTRRNSQQIPTQQVSGRKIFFPTRHLGSVFHPQVEKGERQQGINRSREELRLSGIEEVFPFNDPDAWDLKTKSTRATKTSKSKKVRQPSPWIV